MTEDWEALKDAEDLAYFRAELAEVSPGNYPLEEKMRVLEDMREVSSEIENGMREDFARLDEVTQTMFLGRLGASGYRDRARQSHLQLHHIRHEHIALQPLKRLQ